MNRKQGAVLAAGLVLGLALAGAVGAAGWKTFLGRMFQIQYPANFKVIISHPANECDSAKFASPDGKVEFYVFSPMWNGDPEGIALEPASERIKDDNSETKNNKLVRWYTIEAKNGGYQRSYVDTTYLDNNTRHVFGIKYVNDEALKKYQPDYAKFKASLVQMAD
jgi:hypothetical protein